MRKKTKAVYSAVFSDNYDLNILIMDIPPDDRCDASAWIPSLKALKQAKIETGANVAMLATLPENLSETISDELMASDIVPLHGMEEMILAVNAAIEAGKIIKSEHKPLLIAHATTNDITLDEAQSKAAIAKYGLNFPRNITLSSIEKLTELPAEISYPVVLKGLGIAHKSEAGAVILNLCKLGDIKHAASNMQDVTSYLIEEMVPEPVAEILVGVTRDATGIFLLTIGAGGIMTELLEDSTSVIIPSTRVEIGEAISKLKIFKILNGYRGQPAANMDTILDAIEAIQAYCTENLNLIELDINPLMALEDRAIAVDALIKLGETK